MPNPFQVQSPVVGDDFYGHQDIVSGVLDEQLNHVWIIGTRRGGKTSILRQIEHVVQHKENYSKKYIPIFWDMQGVADEQGLHERFVEGLWDLNKDKFDILGIDRNQADNMSLKDIFHKIGHSVTANNIQVLFLCDEVEALVEISKNNDQIISVLRYYFQSKWNKTVIAATGALWNLKENLKDVSPFLSGFTPPKYVLGSLSKTESLSLIRKIEECDKKLSISSWEEDICRLTNQIPFYIQLVCMTICDSELNDFEEIKQTVFNNFDFNVVLENDLEGLNTIEMLILLQIVENPGIRLDELKTRILKEIDIGDIQDFIRNLKLLSYIEERTEQRFNVPNHFLQLWYKEHLRKIVEKRHPHSFAEIFEHLGDVYTIKGDLSQAIESYEKAVEKEPDFENYSDLGRVLFRDRKYDRAIKNLEKALQLKPDETRIRLNLGIAYNFNGDDEKYKEHFIKAFESDPKVAFDTYEYLMKKITEVKKQKERAKDRLIQQFSHTLRSSLVAVQAAIRNVIDTGNPNRLESIQFEIERVDRNLALLSLSARKPEQLRKKIISSLSETGYSLSNVLFSSLISSLSLVLNDPEYREYVLKRYLSNVSGIRARHTERFIHLDEHEKERLLTHWKDGEFWFDEKERQEIYSKKWETLSGDEAEKLYHNWLNNELIGELEGMRRKHSLTELVQWLEENFMRTELNIESEIYFETDKSEGAMFHSWIFSEICLNCLKYGKSGGRFSIFMGEKAEQYNMCFKNEIAGRKVFAPGSQTGLEVLAILTENMGGAFRYGRSELDNFYEVIIEIPRWEGDNK